MDSRGSRNQRIRRRYATVSERPGEEGGKKPKLSRYSAATTRPVECAREHRILYESERMSRNVRPLDQWNEQLSGHARIQTPRI